MNSLKSLSINQFRAITELSLTELTQINVILGDNNSGKTTILEAIELLNGDANLGNIKQVLKNRMPFTFNDNNFYDSFINLFNMKQKEKKLEFIISSENKIGSSSLRVTGNEDTVSIDQALEKATLSESTNQNHILLDNTNIFKGNIYKDDENGKIKTNINLTSLDNIILSTISKNKIIFISSFDHLRFDLLKNIVKNIEYKKLAISILKIFNEPIFDICYTKTDHGNFVESMITENGQSVPFSILGDGIKKILYIVNKLLESKNSILLIDEIETSLHRQYYEDFFKIIFTLAQKLNVQLFITTHSIEAIEAILKFGDYENNKINDPIKIITLRKINDPTTNSPKIIARNVFGRYVYENRKTFNFDVRL